ncbi:MAG: DUF4842 domain-containing protein [Prevotellaceae bacterium]|nr:DUF4842 domain-containing protein [Prevotellaceae bacterium]
MKTTKTLLAMALAAITVTSCTLEENVIPAEETYTREFIKSFGLIDSEQTWNMATQVTANVSLDASLGADSISVYTAFPGGSESYIVAKYPASTASFTFDYLQGKEDAYVVVKNSNGNVVLSDYYDINNGVLNIASTTRTTRADEETCNVTLGDKITDFGSFYDNQNYYTDLWYNQYRNEVQYKDAYNIYPLNNVVATDASTWKISDIIDIVGTGGVFHEQVIYGQECNLVKWEDELQPSKGVRFTLSKDGPVSLEYMYGATDYYNKFGYLYYKDGATNKEILQSPHFILIDKAEPQSNVKCDGSYIEAGNSLTSLVTGYESSKTDHELTGTKYNLVYFGEDGTSTPTYTFPEGTHIVFFEIVHGQDEGKLKGENLYYSLPWMNGVYNHIVNELHPSWSAETKNAETFVTYKWGEKTLMGMEDLGGDDDMNDIVFFVDGNFDEYIPDINPETKPTSWIVACEDLGGTDDFDFNDIVFSVSHTSGETTATITPLAAGGIYAAYIMNDDIKDLEGNNNKLDSYAEIHDLLNSSSRSAMINTTTIDHEGKEFQVTVPADFSMSYNATTKSNMGGFYVKVVKGDETITEVTPPSETGTVPQMICVPDTWLWPIERTNISEAYPDFGTWGSNYGNTTWYSNYTSGTVVSRSTTTTTESTGE